MQATAAPDASEAETPPSLTTAQEEARQLATVLNDRRDEAETPAMQVPLVIVPDRVMQLGGRLHLTLITTASLEARLVGGVRTLASPVATTAETERDDARRPRFLSAEQSAVALEILAK